MHDAGAGGKYSVWDSRASACFVIEDRSLPLCILAKALASTPRRDSGEGLSILSEQYVSVF